MAKKWKFMMTILIGVNNNHDLNDYFPEEKNIGDETKMLHFEVSKLSPHRFQSLSDDEIRDLVDWSSVDNPMRLHSYVENVGDANTLSFQVKWGRISTYLLRATIHKEIFPFVILWVKKINDTSGKKRKKKGNKTKASKTLMKISMLDAQMLNSGHFVKTGHDWFSIEFSSSAQSFQ